MVTRMSTEYSLAAINQNIQKARMRHFQAAEPIASGKRMNHLSDDPSKISEYFRLQNELERTDQYQLNINAARTRLDMTDVVVNEAVDLVNEAYQLSIQAVDPSLSNTELTSISNRLTDIYNDIVDLANTKIGDTYIFSGYLSNVQPFTANGAPPPPMLFNGDSNTVMVQATSSKQVQVSLDGNALFTGGGGNVDVFLAMDDLNTAVLAQNATNIGTGLDNLQTVLDQFYAARATIGNSMQQLDTAQRYIERKELTDNERLSLIADADLAEATSELSYAEYTLQSAFAVSSRVMEISLSSFFD